MALIKTDAEIEIMAEAGRRLAHVLQVLRLEAAPGTKTKFLDALALNLIRESGSDPAFLYYRPQGSKRPYPATLCVSVNSTIVHGLPSEYEIKEGDLVKLDLGLVYKGFYVDSALTVGVSPISPTAKELMETTEQALARGIHAARPGNTLGDIGWAIEQAVMAKNFSVAEMLTGHGIGRELHEEPSVFNTGRPGKGMKLEPGMVLAIEPMVVAGKSKVKCLRDDSFVTADGMLAAHFEHTVAITKNGPRILTRE